MLSGAGPSLDVHQALISSTTTLTSSLTTAVTGSRITFSATVEDSSTDAPIASGKVNFVAKAPRNIALGDVKLTQKGQATVSTARLTTPGDYLIRAQYTPTNSRISPSVAGIAVKVIPVPLNVPTVTTITTPANVAETGQHVPFVATVKDAGTGVDVHAGIVEPISGKVAFLTDSANPIVLGEANLGKNGQASLSTKMLRNAGPYQVIAAFLPADNYYAVSTSAPIPVTITPRTVNALTATSLQIVPPASVSGPRAVTNSIETGEPVTLNAVVQNTNSDLADGFVKFVTLSRHPIVLGEVPTSLFGQQVSFATAALKKVGTYQIEAKYVPNTNRFAQSSSPPTILTVTPLTAVAFRVTPDSPRGHPGRPVSFTVTALNRQRKPLTHYTGTVTFVSPTDSSMLLPRGVYVSLGLTPPPPQAIGLAAFLNNTYTFTPADLGTHVFVNGVTFNKGGAETLRVVQANNNKVFGQATFAIA
jgi:hypothetical protein